MTPRDAVKYKIQYPYAYDEAHNLISILDVTTEDRRVHTYTCPSCNHIMKPRLGSKNANCFAHAEGEKCAQDRYLHDTAKLILKHRFDTEDSFPVEFSKTYICKNPCQDYNDLYCRYSRDKWIINLKDSYSECLVEHKIEKFVPDLALIDKTGKHLPIFLEIWHKHKSTEEKMLSGNHIIEIRLRTFEDLNTIAVGPLKESDNITFTGFKTIRITPQEFDKELHLKYYCKTLWTKKEWRENSPISKFTIYDSGKTWCQKILESEIENHKPSAVIEVVINDEQLRKHPFVPLEYVAYRVAGRYALRCVFCDNCGGSSLYQKLHWCKLRLNGSTRNGRFNNLKGIWCNSFAWPDFYGTIDETIINDLVVSVWKKENY